MKENKDELIGIRFTKSEREVIEVLAENREMTMTDFIREAIFSHINNLINNPGVLNVNFYFKKFNEMNNSIETLNSCIDSMKKEFDIYDLARIKTELAQMEEI